jgi:acetyl-CoA carboxylase alpha subunit
MKLQPIKTKEDYKKFNQYLDSLYGVELTENQTNEILIIQQLLDHYEQNNMSKVSLREESKENFDYIYELIQNVSELEGYGLIERVCKLQEEVGELSAETLKIIGFKNSNLTKEQIKENILLESVDCLIMSMDILSTQGYSKDEIIKMADSQINKWVNNLKTK